MKTQDTSKKRRTYFIKKAFQLKMMARFVVLLIVGSLISGTLFYFLATSDLKSSLYDAHLQIKNTWDILFPSILITNISVVVLVSIATIYTVLYLSHKIAGPLYRFEKNAEEIGKGNFAINLNLREHDELLPLQNAFRGMVENLQKRILELKSNFIRIREIHATLEDAVRTSSLSDGDKQALSEAIKELIVQSEKTMSNFTFSKEHN